MPGSVDGAFHVVFVGLLTSLQILLDARRSRFRIMAAPSEMAWPLIIIKTFKYSLRKYSSAGRISRVYCDPSVLRAFLSPSSRCLVVCRVGPLWLVDHLDVISATTAIRSLLNVRFFYLFHLYRRISLPCLSCSYGYSASCRAVCFILCVQFNSNG
jgi:hypothetical protein